MGEIVNKIQKSKLKTIDLEEFYPKNIVSIDIKQWLYEGIILKEKDFRLFLTEFDWSIYDNCLINLHCSEDVIIPSWAYMLVSVYLKNARKVIVGDKSALVELAYYDSINDLDLQQYTDLPVIVKGCSSKDIPDSVYLYLVDKLIPFARKIMYGEACSSVPLFSKK
ncbi:MAG: DUF2480 family protein [Flavobacteriaceae bacterium]|nr:DUF2480 family protein [Flavobacteriaceae bacterium]